MGKTGITCKEFSGMIPAFMEGTLEDRFLRGFLTHYDSCVGCREELEIQYLVGKVFEQMDAGEEINLSRDLPAYIEGQRRKMEFRDHLGFSAFLIECFTVLMAVVTAILYLR